MADNQQLIHSLLECDVLQLGNFKLISGDFSPIYIDLRRIIHYPKVVKDVVATIRNRQIKEGVHADTVCGVPYTGIPIASVFSTSYDVPMILKRKEAKNYGTRRLLEGVFRAGNSCLLIEDIVCSGTSVMGTLETLRKEGLKVQHCIVVVDRGQGGIENLKRVGLSVYPLLHINAIFDVYCSINKTEAAIVQKISSYFKENSNVPIYAEEDYSALSYLKRAKIANHPVAKRLLEIMDKKKTNLCAAINVNHSEELIKFTELVGPHICILKTHIDTVSNFSENLVIQLRNLSHTYDFLIMEDRKFADTGNTVVQQYKNGLYKIGTWADLVTVHILPGGKTVEALKLSSEVDKHACVLIAEISAEDTLTKDYPQKVFQIANNNEDFVIGYVAKEMAPKSKNLIYMNPQITLSSSEDLENQNYKLPEEAVANGADIIIVGREIYQAKDLLASAIEYKTRSFNAYLNRISK